MRKTRLLLLLALLLSLCATASAASLIVPGSPAGQLQIATITDSTGAYVDALTDGDVTTHWSRPVQGGEGPDLTLNLYSATVGEIWVRNGHCYSQNYFNHYDRPAVIAVTLNYGQNRYATSSVTYRYQMMDDFRPSTVSADWKDGYQRLLLPQAVNGVTSIELTIESAVEGYGRTGATLTDIALTRGSHATATPRNRGTATPKPYVAYITPTPGPVEYLTPEPEVEFITPQPTKTPTLVEIITPKPQKTNRPTQVTKEPAVELVTPVPSYPSQGGFIAKLVKRISTRTGPGNSYDEPGTFFGPGDYVKVISKAWGDDSGIWWFHVEFRYGGEWIRAYTPAYRIDLLPDLVPTEPSSGDPHPCLYSQDVYYGPGTQYKRYKMSDLSEGARAVLILTEGDWALIEYHDYAVDVTRRGWVPTDCLSEELFPW